jgi:lipopolysaccharide/colanic/teichoic acid biosynthesis glycosyltransferase
VKESSESWLKRLFDFAVALVLLLLFSPIIIVLALLIYLYDFSSPLYVAVRVGKDGVLFRMIKLRSMVVDADKAGGSSTSKTDRRITPVGRYVRALKLDEIMQFWNVLVGDMSVVGPRPNVPDGVAVYTAAEQRLLSVKPGVTDFASIVFADEGDILSDYEDPDSAYDELIRPWKSRLALFYLANRGFWLDLRLMVLTAVSVISRQAALNGVIRELQTFHAPSGLVAVARREQPLQPAMPPGLGDDE